MDTCTSNHGKTSITHHRHLKTISNLRMIAETQATVHPEFIQYLLPGCSLECGPCPWIITLSVPIRRKHNSRLAGGAEGEALL
jgi:hypothetical protein